MAALTDELVAAYENADYVVFTDPKMVLRIGRPSAALEALLEAGGAASVAYVTAANPRGELRGAPENEAALAALLASQRAAGYACYPGEGRDPQGRWPAEPSALVVGISRAEAERLGRAWDQNAIVFIARGAAPGLVLLNSSAGPAS